MAAQGLQPVSAGYALTDSGRAWLRRLDFEAPEPNTRRRFAYPCLDWSERRDHLAGQLADQLYLHLVAQGWVRSGAGRDVAVTPVGQRVLVPLLAQQSYRGPPFSVLHFLCKDILTIAPAHAAAGERHCECCECCECCERQS